MGGGEKGGDVSLFETVEESKGRRIAYKIFAVSIFVGIVMVLGYRVCHIPRTGEAGRWAWLGLFAAELWFSFYWIITQSVRWNVVHRHTTTFKDSLSLRYEDKLLSGIDIFVCTADPVMEPPILVINTVLSVMAYGYPPEKLSVYLSDDGGSDLTFYALLEASHFSKHWIPFCNKFKVEPRSPEALFARGIFKSDDEWLAIKKLYENMKKRVMSATELGRVPEEVREQHKGFSEWNAGVTKYDHQTILQILIDGRDPNAVEAGGVPLPTLVYLAREKRPQYPHNFKAGAMNALIRVSSEISNGEIILNVDCDMYSNNSETLRDVLCFFMDEVNGDEISYVQFPQTYYNVTKKDIYCNENRVVNDLELAGIDGYGGALYCGSGCFHRREAICGRKYSKEWREQQNRKIERKAERSISEVEEKCKELASCTHEKGTQWGKEMGLMYGCPVEDIITGLAIQCRAWKPIYYNPERPGFLGTAPTTLLQHLVQYKRWSEGMFQIVLSKYCPFLFGRGKIKLGLQMGYCVYCLWAANSLPTLYYVFVPSLCFFNGISLFPKMSSLLFIPFAYVFVAKNVYSLVEALWCKYTVEDWWNLQRMVLIRRTTSFLFGFVDVIVTQLGFSQTTFVITGKVDEEEASKRYEQGIFEFGASSPMFTVIATVALFNLFSLVGGVKRMVMGMGVWAVEEFISQIIVSGLVVAINIPIYEAIFIRKDKGRMPTSTTVASLVCASLLCLIPVY
ncbi:cellulose synthase-like protein E6 isoform X1 [Macadamia integrifolia]|uniref:cellulose synthase-like protein E6 isoform X1 n=1 Tax=Macadamia integrifolia TaxID=60698 RepID=UPI001C5295A6|nr:cellulose synthase-like protein E6 isoform X1 [Macadamia integrifolia]